MTRVAGLLLLLTAASAALFLFHIKQEVREMEEELDLVQRDILRHQEAIQVLEAEWSYLNRPARLAELAVRHLELQPLRARQFVRIDDLPRRDRAPGSTDPGDAEPAQSAAPTLAVAPASHAGGTTPMAGTAR